jgi:hypothetical protein
MVKKIHNRICTLAYTGRFLTSLVCVCPPTDTTTALAYLLMCRLTINRLEFTMMKKSRAAICTVLATSLLTGRFVVSALNPP